MWCKTQQGREEMNHTEVYFSWSWYLSKCMEWVSTLPEKLFVWTKFLLSQKLERIKPKSINNDELGVVEVWTQTSECFWTLVNVFVKGRLNYWAKHWKSIYILHIIWRPKVSRVELQNVPIWSYFRNYID